MAFATAFLLGVSSAGIAASDPNLVIVDQPGCVYCERWDAEIAPAYPKTAEGQYAPLIRADLREGPPDGITYARRVVFTPTFILVEDGQELARLEGYPGEDFFWPLLTKLLSDHTDYTADTGAETVQN
ncbi:thioredoxin family protein [Marivita sp. S6314]|uniref:thioredoxin family protein n=1 Tax=Marivita sp. S6314 TaxID=2926406 RepID=UPI001FF4C99A|nr:thioredoxin family protein [Marivita sp. S6314]MCK0151992.1 thioredoxin family protein [Marivita sp. S6314]